MHNFTDRATGSGGETTSLGAENSQFSRTFYTNQLTPINWLYGRGARMKPRNAIKGLKKPFSNLSDSQFIENDRLDPILSFSINWESDRLEKEWIRAQIHYNTNFGAKKRAKSRFWNLLEYIYCMNTHKLCSLHGWRSTSFGSNYLQNQGIHSILRIHKSDPTEMRKWRNCRSFGTRMRSELHFITSVCCGRECDLKGC